MILPNCKTVLLLLLLLSLFPVFPSSGLFVKSSTGSGYHVIKKITLGGEGGWDYLTLDPQSRRLYISRATHVIVMDADSGKVVGDIPNTLGVHGIALVGVEQRVHQ